MSKTYTISVKYIDYTTSKSKSHTYSETYDNPMDLEKANLIFQNYLACYGASLSSLKIKEDKQTLFQVNNHIRIYKL